MSDTPDFTAETRAILDALASAYRRGAQDTIARLMAGVAPPAAPVVPVTAPAQSTPRHYPPRNWNDSEDALLRSEWGKTSPEDIGAVLHRSGDAIRLRATKIGLPRLPRFAFMKGEK